MTERAAIDVPVKLVWMNGKPVVTLRALPAGWTRSRFWDETLVQAMGRPRLLALDHAPDPPDGWRPAGSIFHMQRCGSTLVCHLLDAFSGVRGLSEPMILQALLTGPGSAEQRVVWLRRLVELHRASLCASGEALVVKWGSLDLAFEPEIAAAFPGVPAVFCHRDPAEVLVSCVVGPPEGARRLQPRFFAPHLRPTEAEIESGPFGELMARWHGSCFFHARNASALRLLDYRDLPSAVWERLAAYFGLSVPEGSDLQALRERAKIDAKDPEATRLFTPDSESKQKQASAEVRALVARFVEPERTALLTRHPAL